MQSKTEVTLSRREFMSVAASVAGTALLAGGSAVLIGKKKPDVTTELWRINPAFRIKEISSNTVELFTNLGNGERLQHHFTDVEADFFRTAAREKRLDTVLESISEKNQLSLRDCRKKLNQSIREFEAAKLIYTGEKMLVKIVEVRNG